jgi:hypothetical protein
MNAIRRNYMKKISISTTLLFGLCAFLIFGLAFKADVSAEDWTSKVAKIAYIDSSNNLNLRFNAAESFSTDGYTYEVEGTSIKGTINKGDDTVKISLGTEYKPETGYTLKVASKTTSHYIKVNYFTGSAKYSDFTIAQEGTGVKSSWKISGKNDYTKQCLLIGQSSGLLKVTDMADVKIGSAAQTSYTGKATGKGKSEIKTGMQMACIVGMKGDNYYGYGQVVSFAYLVQPTKVALNVHPGKKSAHLFWTTSPNATHYLVYMKKPGSAAYNKVGKTKDTSYIVEGLKKGKKYSFKVKAVATLNGVTKEAPASSAKSCKLKTTPAQVKNMKLFVSDLKGADLAMSWDAAKGARSYVVYIKQKGENYWTNYGSTTNVKCSLKRLDYSKTYYIRVYSRSSGNALGPASKTLTVTPDSYLKKNRDRLLASKVRGIRYISRTKADYTTARYTPEVKLAYVNYKGFSSSTKYLIWVSLYTQQCTIYSGSKGHWKIVYTDDIASGSPQDRTPRGKHKISYKEPKWQHHGWRSSYVSHFYKKASFHMRPKYNNGKVKDKRMKKPISNACVRCYDYMALFIYKKIPRGTTVIIH